MTTRSKTFVSLAVSVAVVGLYALAVTASGSGADKPTSEPLLVIENVRLFDGETVSPRATVTVRGGVIEDAKAVDTDAPTEAAWPESTTVVDGSGKTLLPGLIDSHTHTWGDALTQALSFGVTTELDMFTASFFAQAQRAEQAAGPVPGRADLFSAGTLATAPGGHGTQFGVPIPVLEGPDDAAGFVADRIAEGSDYLKIIVENGSVVGREIPTLGRPTIKALIDAAHEQGLMPVAHVSTEDDFRFVVESGIAGLVHVYRDQPPSPGVVELAADRGVFVIPTLAVIDHRGGEASAHARGATRALHEAGVPILAGSDAPNPGTAHGDTVHREMELLVAAGLSPTEALAAATSVPADAFDLDDRGRIAPGKKADLVLVEGNPTETITDTRRIVSIWKDGVEVERSASE